MIYLNKEGLGDFTTFYNSNSATVIPVSIDCLTLKVIKEINIVWYNFRTKFSKRVQNNVY